MFMDSILLEICIGQQNISYKDFCRNIVTKLVGTPFFQEVGLPFF